MTDAMVTASRLRVYDDILSPEQIESLIAICAFYSQAYGQCSKAFIKLESIQSEKQQAYEDLAMSIFVRHPPSDPDHIGRLMGDASAKETCVVTGRPVSEKDRDNNVSKYSTCNHVAFKEFWRGVRSCPLCHTMIVANGGGDMMPRARVQFSANFD